MKKTRTPNEENERRNYPIKERKNIIKTTMSHFPNLQ